MKLHTPTKQQCQHCEHEQAMKDGVEQCEVCGNIIVACEQCHKGACGRCTDGSQFREYKDGTDKVPSTCTFKQRSNAFRSGFTPSCGHKLVKQGEVDDCKRGATCTQIN